MAAADAGNPAKNRYGLNYFVSVKPNGATRFSAIPNAGEDGLVWSGRYRESLQRLYDAFLPRTDEWNDDMSVEFDLGPNDVSLKVTVLMDPSSCESLLADFEQALSRKRFSPSDSVRSQIYGASQITVQKNKVVVVANLPRDGLESLLTKRNK